MSIDLKFSTGNDSSSNDSNAYLQGPTIKKLNNLALALANTLYKLASDGREPQQNLSIPANLV